MLYVIVWNLKKKCIVRLFIDCIDKIYMPVGVNKDNDFQHKISRDD